MKRLQITFGESMVPKLVYLYVENVAMVDNMG